MHWEEVKKNLEITKSYYEENCAERYKLLNYLKKSIIWFLSLPIWRLVLDLVNELTSIQRLKGIYKLKDNWKYALSEKLFMNPIFASSLAKNQ